MRKSHLRLLAGSAMALGLAAASGANAATIVLNNIGGVTPGSDAAIGFQKAANFWGAMFTNNVTINLNVGYAPLGPGILGSTSSPRVGVFTDDVEFLLNANTHKTSLDNVAVANMPTLDAGGFLDVITNGYDNPATKGGVNSATRVFDNNDTTNNATLAITRANAKALGYTGLTGPDAQITFSSAFAFDFDPTDGISDNSYDFIGIAIHEIGHALGFVSGVDTYDILGTLGPNSTDDRNFNDFTINSVLDLYRYSADAGNVAPGGPFLDWSTGTASYFSLDKGATQFSLGGNVGLFSTGQFNGDGRQASHWKDNTYAGGALCSNATKVPIGILDPTAGRCEALAVTATDLAAFDAIGWNLAIGKGGILNNGNYVATTASIARGRFFGDAPEPSTWAEMILGFGGLGALARSNRRKLARVSI
jgi:hypothetical protein